MIFKNTPRTSVVHWVNESVAQRVITNLNSAFYASAVFTALKCGAKDYYNVYEVFARRGNKRVGYVLECYSGGAYIVRPRLPSEPVTATRRETVRVMPHLRHCDTFSGV